MIPFLLMNKLKSHLKRSNFLNYLIFFGVLIFVSSFQSYSNEKRPWPVDEPIVGNSYCTPLYFEHPYFHHAIDILAKAGTPVRAVSSGMGQLFYDPEDIEFRSGVLVKEDSGKIWLYRHLKMDSIPAKFNSIYNKNVPVKRGEILGMIADYGHNFSHVHLELWENSRIIDPFPYLEPLEDNIAPVVHEIIFFKNESDDYFKSEKGKMPIIGGEVDIVANISDIIPPSPYELPPYKISYSIEAVKSNSKNNIPKTLVYQFDQLPGVDKIPPIPGFEVDPIIIDIQGDVSGIFKFHPNFFTNKEFFKYKRDYYFIITNFVQGKVDPKKGFWKTDGKDSSGIAHFPNGKYIVTVYAEDFSGNKGEKSVEVFISNN